MKLTRLLFGFILGLSAFPVMSGSGHEHGHDHGHGHSHESGSVSQEQVQKNAAKIVARFTDQKKLKKSWGTVEASSIEKITVQGKSEWKVTFINKDIADTARQAFYVFMTPGGKYIAANFTGK